MLTMRGVCLLASAGMFDAGLATLIVLRMRRTMPADSFHAALRPAAGAIILGVIAAF